MSKKFVAKDHIAALNIFKNALNGSEFTESQLIDGLKQCGIPSNEVFRSELKKSAVLKVIAKDKYVFASKDPIYFGVLHNIYLGYHQRVRQYSISHKEKKLQKMRSLGCECE